MSFSAFSIRWERVTLLVLLNNATACIETDLGAQRKTVLLCCAANAIAFYARRGACRASGTELWRPVVMMFYRHSCVIVFAPQCTFSYVFDRASLLLLRLLQVYVALDIARILQYPVQLE